ncbi:MAG: lytic transglycosylase domain-containing protein [Acidobacteriota bacterium]
MRIFILLFIIFSVILSFHLHGEIIVKQGTDGRIIVSNNPGVSNIRSTPSVVNFTVSSYSSNQVPSLYSNKISKLSKKYKIREDLILAVARAESAFNPFAKSKKGAVGIMQLMKSTAKHYGVTNRYDADQNLDGGIRHLKYLYEKYNKDLSIVLAAYNAGEQAVKKYNGVPPYKETRNYIKKVKKFMGLPYSGVFYSKAKTTIFKYETKDGRIILSDSPPPEVSGKVTVFD